MNKGLKETQGDLEGARRLFLECEQIYVKVLGADHEETLDAVFFQECEQIYVKVLGADHEETLDAAMRALTVGEEKEEEQGEEGDSDEGEEDDQAGDSGER